MKVVRWLDEYFEENVLVILLALISVVMMTQIIMRYAFSASLSWPEEFTRYCFVWSVFIGTSYSVKKRNMLRIDAITGLFSQRGKDYMNLIVEIIILLFFGFLCFNSIEVVQRLYVSGQTSPAMELPMYLVYASTVVGFGLTIIRSLQNLVILTKVLKHKEILEKGGN